MKHLIKIEAEFESVLVGALMVGADKKSLKTHRSIFEERVARRIDDFVKVSTREAINDEAFVVDINPKIQDCRIAWDAYCNDVIKEHFARCKFRALETDFGYGNLSCVSKLADIFLKEIVNAKAKELDIAKRVHLGSIAKTSESFAALLAAVNEKH